MTAPAFKIPLTELRHLYGMFDLFTSLDCHRALAKEVLRDKNPSLLAGMFQRSVDRFGGYANIEEPFYPERPPRKDLPDATKIDSIGGDLCLTAFLKAVGTAEVVDNPERSNRVRRPDLLLANAHDRLPILAEVKVGGDKDPFYALIQLLMYAAELVTVSQLARLQRHYPQRFTLPAVTGTEAGSSDPVLDLYIVLSNYNPRSGVRQEILETTNQLCQRLVAETGISRYIRRIACLDVTLEKDKRLRFTKVFSYSDR